MVKNTFIYLVVIVLVGVAAWFFVRKANDASNQKGLTSVSNESTPTPTISATPESNMESEWTKLSNGLEMQDVVIGSGQEAKNGDVVATHYSGTLANGKKFDSSYDRGEPFAFILGGGMVIKGWDLGVLGMKVGGKRKLIIPAELGYGSRGAGGGAIPPNSTLFFDIELMAVETPQKSQ